jgi:PBP1b-binding outer membrane lipoprotein LpoB
MKTGSTISRHSALTLLAGVALLAGCSDTNNANAGDVSANSDQVWAPAKLTSVSGVPEAQVEATLKTRLAGTADRRSELEG